MSHYQKETSTSLINTTSNVISFRTYTSGQEKSAQFASAKAEVLFAIPNILSKRCRHSSTTLRVKTISKDFRPMSLQLVQRIFCRHSTRYTLFVRATAGHRHPFSFCLPTVLCIPSTYTN